MAEQPKATADQLVAAYNDGLLNYLMLVEAAVPILDENNIEQILGLLPAHQQRKFIEQFKAPDLGYGERDPTVIARIHRAIAAWTLRHSFE